MQKILSEKFSNRLFKTIDELCSNVISTEKLEKVVECVSLSAAKVNKNQPKSKIYPLQRGKIPYVEAAMTEGRKAIKSLLNYKTFSDLQYR